MIALLQRVSSASVTVAEDCVGRIERGLLVLLGVAKDDDESHAKKLASKVARYRCFPDAATSKPMDRSVLDVSGGALVVSQFTLCADTRKGLRPGFDPAAPPTRAEELYEVFCEALRAEGVARVETGHFQAFMQVESVNDGPVTLWLEV